ncbi:MAG: radical SAM family heme chaperone HemW [Bacillota bacterium]
MPFGLYVHIPFCLSKCYYCDFNSYAGCADLVEPYLNQLEDEAAYYGRDPRVADRMVATIFVGGGTPTILSPAQLERVGRLLQDRFRLTPNVEWTVEANPKTLSLEKLQTLRAMGVNRLSLGVQAMDDRLLRAIGRVHSVDDVAEQVRLVRAAGFANLSLDLIYGLPEQSLADWERTLEAALRLEPEHISAYGLKVEDDTPFAAAQAAGTLELPGEDHEVAMYRLCQSVLLAAGFEQYEISNFALPGRECQHNLLYWGNHEYLGLGAGAYSFLNHHRFAHERSLTEYLKRWQEEKRPPISEDELLSPELERAETVFLGLRRRSGISDGEFSRRFGHSLFTAYGEEIDRLMRQQLLERCGDSIRLTETGLMVSNQVFMEFLP